MPDLPLVSVQNQNSGGFRRVFQAVPPLTSWCQSRLLAIPWVGITHPDSHIFGRGTRLSNSRVFTSLSISLKAMPHVFLLPLPPLPDPLRFCSAALLPVRLLLTVITNLLPTLPPQLSLQLQHPASSFAL